MKTWRGYSGSVYWCWCISSNRSNTQQMSIFFTSIVSLFPESINFGLLKNVFEIMPTVQIYCFCCCARPSCVLLKGVAVSLRVDISSIWPWVTCIQCSSVFIFSLRRFLTAALPKIPNTDQPLIYDCLLFSKFH